MSTVIGYDIGCGESITTIHGDFLGYITDQIAAILDESPAEIIYNIDIPLVWDVETSTVRDIIENEGCVITNITKLKNVTKYAFTYS